MRCVSCQSLWHLLEKCLDSYKNLKKFCSAFFARTNEDEASEEANVTDELNEFMMKVEQEKEIANMILFTGDKQKITGLGGETLRSILLDCGCSANVAGEGWWNSYYASLSQE